MPLPWHCHCGQIHTDIEGMPPITTPPQPTPVTVNAWEALHTLDPTPAAYDQWAKTSVPSCGDCRQHWQQITTKEPPDYDNFFAWTVAMHNLVNTRIGKPIVSIADARTIWLL